MEGRKKTSEIQLLKKICIRFSALLFFVSAFFFMPLQADAATLSLSPASGSYKVGQTFSVGVYVGSSDEAMNAAQGVISFPSTLEVVSLSKNGTVLSLWVQEPTFSNSKGTVNFEGIVYNPGFTGAVGKVITITFKAKAAGSASVSFSSGAVLANDGTGTNILTGMGKANFTIGETLIPVPEKPSVPVTPAIPLPSAPKVFSSTHPDSTKWYSNNNPTFEWSLTSDIVGVNILSDHEAATDPGTKSDGRISSNTYPTVADGTWYFHIRLQNARGWGPTASMQFNIDTEKPANFNITELPRATSTDPVARFVFTASDTLSGIEAYEVKIDTGDSQILYDDGTHTFVVSMLEPGLHTLAAKALDKAGNYLENSVSFEITAPPKPVIATPVVEEVRPVVTEVRPPSILFTNDPILLIGGAILFMLIVVLLILLILYIWYKFKYIRKRLNENPESVAELEQSLSKIFIVLRGKIEEYALLVEKTRVKKKLAEHELGEEENRILSDFKKYLDSAEGIMKKHFRK